MKRILAILILLCLLTGCVTQGEYIPTGGGFSDGDGSSVETQGQISGELRLPCNNDSSFHPYTATDSNNRALLSLVYQGLFSINDEYEIAPILCKSYQVSQDLRTYTFYLEDATFSDGQAITAQDVVASYKAAKNTGYYAGRLLNLKSIHAAEDGGVVMTMEIPYGNLPLLLDIPIIKASEIDAAIPLGTGPYILETVDSGKQLRRQPAWWCTASLSITATVIPLLHGTSQQELWDLYKFSQLSMVCTDDYVDFRGDYELWECENGMFVYLACNEKSPVFSNDAIRQSLTHAIDRDTLVSKFFRGFAHSATLPATPSFPYYSLTLAEKYGYQPELFAQAVADAALTNNAVTLLVNKDDSIRVSLAQNIAQMLEDGGLAVTIPELSGEKYLQALKQGQYDLHLGQTKLSPNMDLTAFFSQDGTLNFGGLSDVAINAMNQQALANEGNYQSLHKVVMEDGSLCPILFRSYAIYGRRNVFAGLSPARDNVFYYTLGKTMADVLQSGE